MNGNAVWWRLQTPSRLAVVVSPWWLVRRVCRGRRSTEASPSWRKVSLGKGGCARPVAAERRSGNTIRACRHTPSPESGGAGGTGRVLGKESVRIRHSIPASRAGPSGDLHTGSSFPSYQVRTWLHESVPRQLQVGEIPLLDQRRHQLYHRVDALSQPPFRDRFGLLPASLQRWRPKGRPGCSVVLLQLDCSTQSRSRQHLFR